jgi:hypothetical protein
MGKAGSVRHGASKMRMQSKQSDTWLKDFNYAEVKKQKKASEVLL